MGTLDDLGQKVKGKVQKVTGEVNQRRGVKGGIQKMKGAVNDTVADMKLKSRTRRRRNI